MADEKHADTTAGQFAQISEQVICRLVAKERRSAHQNKDSRIVGERAGDGHALSHGKRQIFHVVVQTREERRVRLDTL